MSKYAEFCKKIAASPELATELEKILKANNVTEGASFSGLSDEALSVLISFAKKAGFDFTLAEIKAYANEAALGDNELEAVTGGRVDTPIKPTISPMQ